MAFLGAATAWVIRAAILQKERQIKQAPPAERAALIESALEFFRVDTRELSRRDKYDLAVRQIHVRALRVRTTAVVIVILAMLAAGVSTFAIWQEKKQNPVASGNSNDNQNGGSHPPGVIPTTTPTPSPGNNLKQKPDDRKVTQANAGRNSNGQEANRNMNRPPLPSP